MAEEEEKGIKLTDDQLKSRRSRSVAIGWALAFLVGLIFLVTYVKLGPGVMNRPL